MKNNKKPDWITILCIAGAVLIVGLFLGIFLYNVFNPNDYICLFCGG